MSGILRRPRVAASGVAVATVLTLVSGLPAATASAIAPGPVVGPVVQAVAATSISVQWTPPADTSTVTGYDVEYSSNQGTSWQSGAEVDDPAATSATIDNLTTGTSYDVRVSAFGPGGTGPTRIVDPVSSIGMWGYGNCAVLLSGRVRCWDYAQPYDVPQLASSVQVSVGGNRICAVRTNGDLTCGSFQGYPNFTNLAGLPHDITQVSLSTGVGCALTETGDVWCWGTNVYGQLGIGVSFIRRSPPVEVTGLGGPASAVATQEPGTACAVLRDSGQLKCWGNDASGLLGDGGGAAEYSPVAVPGISDVVDVSLGLESACASVKHTGADYAVYCWGYTPGSPGATYPPRHVADGYSSVGAHNYYPPTPCLAGPSGGTCYDISSPDIASVTSDGWESGCAQFVDGSVRCQSGSGFFAQPRQLEASAITTAAPTVPDAPLDVQGAPAQGGDPAQVSWLAPGDGGSPITGYQVQRSTDGGANWGSVGTESTLIERPVSEPAFGRADLYRVRAENPVGVSAWSDPAVLTPGGTGPQRFTMQLPDGTPVTGGSVRWKLSDGTAESSVPSALTADGVLTFPRVVAGAGQLTLNDGVLPNGSTVSGSWDVVLGTDPQVLRTPAVPGIVTKTVTVTLPNDVPVVDASVRGTTGFSTDDCATVSAFSFCGGISRVVLTDGDGRARISSWSTGDLPAADVVYSDGVLAQRQSVPLPNPKTTVQLQYMPWLTVNADGSPVDVGQLSTIAFQVNDPPASQPDGIRAAATTQASQGVSIIIKPPAGWSARRCRGQSVLSGTTNTRGRLALHVCASRSGVYRVVAHGAVTTKSILLRVRGAAPMAPTSLTARSPRVGVLTASWARPIYAGGAAVTGYKVSVTSPHQRSRTVTITMPSSGWNPQAMFHRFRGLAYGHLWTVRVRAITRHGVGAAVTGTVRVA